MYREKVPIFSMKLAGYLLMKEFCCVKLKENGKHKGKMVYYYYDSEDLRREMSKWSEIKDQVMEVIK